MPEASAPPPFSATPAEPTLALARALIARRSVTPGDGGCQPLVAERLARSGFVAETFPSGDVANLWLRRGSARPLFVFAGHTDVVPTGPLERWTVDPFAAEVRDGRLVGRGAADMKTSIAAFVVAAEEFVAAHPDHVGSIALLLTSDEEGPAVDGTVVACERLAARGDTLDWCIVGEPSSRDVLGDTIKNGRRGSLSGRLVVRGTQGHIAYPHLAKNPIPDAARAIGALAAIEWDAGNASFPPTSFQVSNVRAGTGATNVIPGDATVDFNFRFSTESTVESLKTRVHAAIDDLAVDRATDRAIDYTIDWTVGGLPFLTPPGALSRALGDAIRRVTGVDAALSTTGGTSDGRFIAKICGETMEFGPINATIHQVDEAIAVADVAPLKDIYRETLAALLAGEPSR